MAALRHFALALALGGVPGAGAADTAEAPVHELPKFMVSPFEGKIDVFIGYEPKVVGHTFEEDKNGRKRRVPLLKPFVKYVRIERLEPGSVREARIEQGSFLIEIEGHRLPGRPKEGFMEFLHGIRVPAGSDISLVVLPPRRYGQKIDDALAGKPVAIRIPAPKPAP